MSVKISAVQSDAEQARHRYCRIHGCCGYENEARLRQRTKAQASRKARNEVMKSLGLTKVRGGLGGIYWE